VLRNNFQTAYHLQEQEFQDGKTLRLALAGETSFLNKASIVNTLNAVPSGSSVEIDGTRASYIDYDVLEIIHDFAVTAKLRNIRLTLIGIPALPAGAPAH
jgi:SulP family sulfate permease